MQERTGRLTERKALALPLPATGYVIHWCEQTPGFGVRITAAGARSWVSERRVDGKTTRRTLGRVNGRSAVSADVARREMVVISGELQQGKDRLIERRAERAEQQRSAAEVALTFAEALKDYTAKKRRAKDGLPLKARTVADYLAMIAPGRLVGASNRAPTDRAAVRKTHDGELFALAATPIAHITAADVRAVYETAAARGERRASYAMQVLRAVLNWHGVKVPANPLSKDTAGKDRIVLRKTAGDPTPIPPERLAAWWKASGDVASREAADLYRLQLLTGARPGEMKGLKVRDVDAAGARMVLHDTKNRKDHTIRLSTQAAAIIAPYLKGKKPGARVFEVADPRKTLAAINASAGTSNTAHDLRATFASVAEEIVSAYSLKRMMNHAEDGDVTGAHYIGKSESQLRASWQAVADVIAGPTE